jgi:hypothetical protein
VGNFDDTARELDYRIAEHQRRYKIFYSTLPLWIVENLLRVE